MWLSPTISNVVNNYVQVNEVKRSTDFMKGTFLVAESFSLYSRSYDNYKTFTWVNRTQTSQQPKLLAPNKSLLTCTLLQSSQFSQRSIQPYHFYFYLQGIGGFWCLFTGLTNWLLRPYIGFQYSKSGVKNLYKYSRTKRRKRTLKDKIEIQREQTEVEAMRKEAGAAGGVGEEAGAGEGKEAMG